MEPVQPTQEKHSAWDVFVIFLKLGLTSFGGPVAHLGFFRDEFVVQRKWMSEKTYADLVALCQFLPGPGSSQVGVSIGFTRAGYKGALAAWTGFTLPSALVLVLFALGLAHFSDTMPMDALHGLKVVAVAVVAQAVWGMATKLCPDAPRISLMAAAACFVLLFPTSLGQISVIVFAGFIGLMAFKPVQNSTQESLPISISKRTGALWIGVFIALLFGLPLAASVFSNQALTMFDAFYRSGSLVFGGGHVVLPLLQAEVVPTGWVSNDTFLAGYGAAQAVPGPLFTFSAFLGASMNDAPTGWLGAIICLVAIFTPSFLLVIGALPFWEELRKNQRTQAALLGINAAVVGLLVAALYQPVWTSAIHSPKDFGLALLALVALMFWKLPAWLVVLASGGLGLALSTLMPLA